MFITVKLLNGYDRSLTYRVPADWQSSDLQGAIVRVPLRTKTELSVVMQLHAHNPLDASVVVREAVAIEPFPLDPTYSTFIAKAARYYGVEPLVFYRRLRSCIERADTQEEFLVNHKDGHAVDLTDEQQKVVEYVAPFITQPSYQPVVVHGVTGSGKTEVYAKLIEQAYKNGGGTVLLLPDVSLAVQFTNRFRTHFGTSMPVFGFHSATSVIEKRQLWHHLLQGQPALIIGVHLPLLLPLPALRLIIVDEEHDPGFQEKQHPRFHSKDLALLRAHIAQLPIILGSATPALTTLFNVEKRGWRLFSLKKRFAGAFPRITVVPLKEVFPSRRSSWWISGVLEAALKDRLAKQEQSIIFINRRGYSFFVQCTACTFIFSCKSCSVSLTLHEHNKLICHYCGISQELVTKCPSCSSSSFTKKGIGTQQVVALLQKLFPAARIGRADLDATVNKKKWQATVASFSKGDLDILVGTQTITKGYHFPGVTLVGAIWADSNLHLPFYHAAETTVQQILQVAGRAGRHHSQSDVIVQTMTNHPAFSYLQETSYLQFCEYEMAHRKELSYPPYVRLASIEIRHHNELLLDTEAEQIASLLHSYNQDQSLFMVLLGPAPPLIHKVKNVFIRIIYLKGPDAHALATLYALLRKNSFKSSLFFTQHPLN